MTEATEHNSNQDSRIKNVEQKCDSADKNGSKTTVTLQVAQPQPQAGQSDVVKENTDAAEKIKAGK